MRTLKIRFLLVLGFAPVFWLLGSGSGDRDGMVLTGWDHRLIAFVVSSEEEGLAMEEIIELNSEQIADRDLLFVNLGNVEVSTDHALDIGPSEKEAWRSLWGLASSESRFVLLGKDGGVKAFQGGELQLGLFFDLIDTMPMRRAEMRDRTSWVDRP